MIPLERNKGMSEREVALFSRAFRPFFFLAMFTELEGGGKAKVHPLVQTPPLFVAAGCREPPRSLTFRTIFRVKEKAKGLKANYHYPQMMVITHLCLL